MSMSEHRNDADEDVRARKAQLLEVSGMWLKDGRPAVFMQFGDGLAREAPVVAGDDRTSHDRGAPVL
jgi:hypothetical protein